MSSATILLGALRVKSLVKQKAVLCVLCADRRAEGSSVVSAELLCLNTFLRNYVKIQGCGGRGGVC